MRWNRVVAAALTVLAGCIQAVAQSTDATVSGTVTDPSGAHVAGVTVKALHVATGVETRTATNEAGVFVFAALPPGQYRVTGEHAGFRKAVVNEIELEVAARLTLNLQLEIGAATETVEVRAGGPGDLAYATSSVGNVVTGRKILELPLAGRSAYDLLTTTAGVVGANFSGNRTGSLNVTIDGINAQDNLLNGLFYIGVANRVSVDRAEEFRIITSPTDAELGRGSGQIQILTRSGTNQYHGSLYEEHRNTVLTANTWFNNQRGNDPISGEMVSPRDVLIRNQYGGRLGGPIRRNRTFFHGNYDGERRREKNATTATVFTEPARRGSYRFFPGAQNANANARIATVDLQGNPLRPPTATGDLVSVSVFGRDPNRPAPDASGIIARQLELIPLPNNYRSGDGLNTAGYTWSRPRHVEFESFDVRADHSFTAAHRLAVSFSHQAFDSLNVAGPQPLPASPGGRGPTETTQYNTTLTSVLRPNLLNELRVGVFRPRTEVVAPYDPQAGFPDIMPKAGGQPFILDMASVTEPVRPTDYGSDNSNRISPVYQFSNNISWLRGRHAFKGGVEVRMVSSAGYDAFAVTPRATIGALAPPVANITTIPGIGQNAGGAQSLLLDLAGSIGNAFQVYNSPGGANPAYLHGQTRYRNWSQHEYSGYFKDEYKITPNLTLNLGLRYEWYATPHERQGRALAPAGGTAGLFGISGSSFADLFQPGRLNGTPTRIQLVGPGTPNPGVTLYGQDNNNFSPNAGLAWSLPWFGKNKTLLRMGYGISYERNPIYLTHNVSGLEPGLSETSIFLPTTLTTVSNLRLPVPPAGAPLDPIPLTARTQTLTGFDTGLRTPYIQNWNLSLQRVLPKNFSLELRYVANTGSKLVREASVNEVNIFENGILDAYRVTQAGGHAPLFDRIFMGLSGVNGTTVTGSDLVRADTRIQGFLFNNNVGGLASYLSGTNNFTNVNGGLLRRVGLPENFVVANPQFATANLTSNFSGSTYNSLQVELEKRFSAGWIFQGNYTWSRALGEDEGDNSALIAQYRTLRNRSLDKRLLSFHRTHVWRSNGLWELPFGPGKSIGRDTGGVIGRIIGGWQMGFIVNLFSGQPVSLDAAGAFNTFGNATPNAAASVPRGLGQVEKTGSGVNYFGGLRQVVDPWVTRITTLQGLQQRSTLRAITDASGALLLVNPEPGQFGNVGLRSIDGPGSFRLDVNLIKRIKVNERFELHLRADAINFTNSPQFGNPDTNINSLNFGRITGADGNRVVVLQMRLNF